jgi:hypothetical protein
MLDEVNNFCPWSTRPRYSFTNYILATIISHPNFVYLPCRHVYSSSDAERLLGWVLILRICDCKRPSPDEMRCHTTVGVWRIVSISGPTCQILLFYARDFFSAGAATYGPSVHVKTWLNPQLLTSFSSCARLLPIFESDIFLAESQRSPWTARPRYVVWR